MADDLIVLIIQDVGVRTAMIGGLSAAGESLMTYDGDPTALVLSRTVVSPSVLVSDASTVGDNIRTIADTPRWVGVIILSEQQPGAYASDRCRWIAPEGALPTVLATLREWRETPA